MKYIEASFTIVPNTEYSRDMLSALLASIGFESFIEYNNGVKAYVQETVFDEASLQEVINGFPLPEIFINYQLESIEDKNWNEEWEKNFFQPLLISNKCVVHSTFHKEIPQGEYNIIINPQMAFGTGHHETTSLIIEELLEADLKDKSVLDMGCGTSILAIFASMKGAEKVLAIDIDNWCVENSKDNITLNNIHNIVVKLGNADALNEEDNFDIIIANINRNILLEDMKKYVTHMNPNAVLYISGFYIEDMPLLQQEASDLKLQFISHREKNKWTMMKFLFQQD